MKKTFLITALTVLTLVGCKKNEMQESSTSNDSLSQMDTVNNVGTEIDSATMAIDSAKNNDVELLDTIAESSKKIKVNNTKGKFSLSETKWKLVEVNDKLVKSNNKKDYYINLDSKSGKFTGFVGCNSIMGQYVMIDATKLQFSNVGSTKMACPDGKIESNFMKMLEKVENYSIEGTTLILNKSNSKDVLKFEAVK